MPNHFSPIKYIFYWLPVIGWMSVIFYLSAQQTVVTNQFHLIDFLFKKTAHFVEYFVLFCLVSQAVYQSTTSPLPQGAKLSLVLCVLYAISDELHQRFVPTREGKFRDIVIDSFGIISAYLLLLRYPHVFSRTNSKHN